MIYAFLINWILFFLAQLNVWRPISSRYLQLVRWYYSKYVFMILVVYLGIREFQRTGQVPDNQVIMHQIFGDGPPTSVIAQYRMNIAALILYTIITITIKLIWP